MRKYAWIIGILLLLCVACDPVGSPGSGAFWDKSDNPRTDLYRVGLYSFPGMNSSYVHLVGNVVIDDYGREMCKFDFNTIPFYNGIPDGEKIKYAMVIMQACKDGKIYYYEDACFYFVQEEGVNEKEFEAFYARNDWGLPLQMDKCSSRIYTKESVDYEGMEDIRLGGKLRDKRKTLFPNLFEYHELCEDSDGNQLFWVTEKYEDRYASMFVIYPENRDYDPEQDVLYVDTLQFGEQLHEFKLSRGWVFD